MPNFNCLLYFTVTKPRNIESHLEYFKVIFPRVARDAMKQLEQSERCFIAARAVAGNELFGNR